MQIQPRLIRLRDAPAYLGINKNTFNRVVRPTLSEVSLGNKQFSSTDLKSTPGRRTISNATGVVL